MVKITHLNRTNPECGCTLRAITSQAQVKFVTDSGIDDRVGTGTKDIMSQEVEKN
jgi:hypothetical protein